MRKDVKAMGSFLGAVLMILILVVISLKASKSSDGKNSSAYVNNNRTSTNSTIRCPTCGATAKVHGSTWECGWCGDFGRVSSK